MKKTLLSLTKYTVIMISVFFIIGITSQIFLESTWFTSSIGYILNKHNFHEVVPGKLYRSGTLRPDEFEAQVHKYNIKTVIDLRKGGDNVKNQGYSEKSLAEKLGVTYAWVPMVGSNTRQADTIKELIALSEQIDGPVLIHCSSGTHRSGVASAIWLMLKNEEKPEDAVAQLSPKYGYFYWERRFKSKMLGHQTIDAIVWNYFQRYKETGIDFKNWFLNQSQEDLQQS